MTGVQTCALPISRTRKLDRVDLPDQPATGQLITELMGKKPELRLAFIQANADLVEELDV